MDLRNQAFEQGLITNFDETKRWQTYKDEHKNLQQNLKDFQKSLEIDIMVPVGSKAFMPGFLYHTNEIFVSHYSNYFSNVTANKALDICELRMKNANERLKSLEIERDLFEQRLELPNALNAFAENQAQDIIEPYDEEAEKKWREEHKINVRKFKQLEADERKNNQINTNLINDDRLIELLNELEIIEELTGELDNEELSNDDDILQLLKTTEINENIQLEESKILPSSYQAQDIIVGNDVNIINENQENDALKHSDDIVIDDCTFDLFEAIESAGNEYDEFCESIKNYSKIHKYDTHKKKKIELNKYLKNPDNKTKENYKEYCIKGHLQDMFNSHIRRWKFNLEVGDDNKNSRISFANEDMIKEIKSENQILNEFILIDKQNASIEKTDIIPLALTPSTPISSTLAIKPKIDYDPNLTCNITFKHSDATYKPVEKTLFNDINIITSPADIYVKYSNCFKSEIDKMPKNLLNIETDIKNELTPTKTILKNKSAVDQETHLVKFSEDGDFESSTVDRATEMNFNFNKPPSKRKLSKFKMNRILLE